MIDRQSFIKCNNGVSAVEFAIIAPIFLVFVYAILNFGIYYYYTSIVENSLFAVSRSMIDTDATRRPRDLIAARAVFDAKMDQYNTASLGDKKVVLSINSLTASSPSLTSKPISEFNITPNTPVVMRVIYPRPELVNIVALVEAWPKIFGNEIDTSIMIEAK
jgi:Flp pilus assembly protein TadG